MEINLKNVKPFISGHHTQRVFTITPVVLRNNLGEVLSRVYYCRPQHIAYIVRHGKLVGVISGVPFKEVR